MEGGSHCHLKEYLILCIKPNLTGVWRVQWVVNNSVMIPPIVLIRRRQVTGTPLTVFWIKINCHCQYVQPAVRTNHSPVLGPLDQWEPSVTRCSTDRSKISFSAELPFLCLPMMSRMSLLCKWSPLPKCWIMSLSPLENTNKTQDHISYLHFVSLKITCHIVLISE